MLRKVFVSIFLSGLLLGIGGGAAYWLFIHRPEPARSDLKARAPLVSTVKLAPRDVREVLEGFGTVRSDREATLTAEVSAPVVELVGDLKEGMAVEAGQVLVRLDDRQYRHELHEAESRLQAAEAELAQIVVQRGNLGSLLEIAEADLELTHNEAERVRKLYEAGNAPKTEYDTIRLKYQAAARAKQQLENELALLEPRRLRLAADRSAAEARAERAALDIERCSIKAPFVGVVASLAVQEGTKVRVGGEIARVVNLGWMEVPLELPVSKRPAAEVGASAVLYVESMPELRWSGTVARIAPVADARSRTFKAYVEVDNAAQATPLLPGYFVKAEIEGPVLPDSLVVPRGAVIKDRLFVVNDHQAHERRVNVEQYLGDDAVVTGDLAPGDLVIVTNLDMLFDGAAVRHEGEELASTNGASEASLADDAEQEASGIVMTNGEGDKS